MDSTLEGVYSFSLRLKVAFEMGEVGGERFMTAHDLRDLLNTVILL